MTLNAFPFRANWVYPVIERWEWLTGVLLPEDGVVEQRIALRQNPRYTLEATLTAPDGEAGFLMESLRTGIGQTWYFPLWHQLAWIPSALAVGATTLNIDTTYQLFSGISHLLFWRNPFYFEVRALTGYSSSQLQFQALTQSFTRGDRVYPTLPGRLLQATDITYAAAARAESRVQVAFDQAPTVTGTEIDPWLMRPEWSESAQVSMISRDYLIDYDQGPRWQAARQPPAQVITNRYLLGSREQIDMLRKFIAYRRGRQVALRMPHWAQPCRLAEDADEGAESLRVYRCGYAETLTGDREIIILKANREDHVITTVTGATADGAYELLELNEPLTAAIPVSDVWSIYPFHRCRLDTDMVEFAYDSDRLARVTLPVHVL